MESRLEVSHLGNQLFSQALGSDLGSQGEIDLSHWESAFGNQPMSQALGLDLRNQLLSQALESHIGGEG